MRILIVKYYVRQLVISNFLQVVNVIQKNSDMEPNKTVREVVKTAPPYNFIIKVIEDKKRIVETLKKGGKLSSITGIKIVSPL